MQNPAEAAGSIDHTLLRPEATESQIRALCREALEYGFCTVCINPVRVSLAAHLLRGSKVKVCTVIGFPLGAVPPEVKQFETRQALAAGAGEVDMVLNLGALKDGHPDRVQADIQGVADLCREHGAVSKVILETCLLTDPEKETACRLCVAAGADFVKTSTGMNRGGATVEDVQLMRRTVGEAAQIKAAGGIRTAKDFQKMRAAGADRIGTSAGVAILEELRRAHSSGSSTIR